MNRLPPDSVVPRSAYQVMVFEMPALKVEELEASARYRVRSMSPLHADQYQIFLHAQPRGKMVLVFAFLVPGNQPLPEPGPRVPIRAGFPVRLPASWPQSLVLVLESSSGVEFYLYQDGYLKAALPPAPDSAAVEAAWAALQRDNPGVPCFSARWSADPTPPRRFSGPCEERFLDALNPAWFPVFRESLPREPSSWPSWVTLGLGLILLGWGAFEYDDHLRTRNTQWATWIQEQTQAAASGGGGAEAEKRWSTLKALTGVPLREILTRLADRWPSGAKILTFQTRGDRIQIEAEGPQAIASLQALLADPWFRDLKAIRIRSTESGLENFLLEGELAHDE